MKKLFSILTSVGLSLTASISTVACNNSKNKNSEVDEYEKEKELEEKQKNTIKKGINELLSDLKYEINEDETHYKSEKAGLDIRISDKDKRPDDDMTKKYITISDFTKNIKNDKNIFPSWDNKKNYITSWDMIEVITAFTTNREDVPEFESSIKEYIEQGKYKWSDYRIKFVEGIASAEEMNKNGPPNQLIWKMGYLTKKSYYINLYEMAINQYFGGDTEDYRKEDHPFIVKSGIEFNEKWINNIISEIVDDKSLVNELISWYKNTKLVIVKEGVNTIGKWDWTDEIWNPVDYPNIQHVGFSIEFVNILFNSISFDIYIKPE